MCIDRVRFMYVCMYVYIYVCMLVFILTLKSIQKIIISITNNGVYSMRISFQYTLYLHNIIIRPV